MPQPRLLVQDSSPPRLVVLDRPLLSIGRRSTADLVLTDSDVSRVHADIVAGDGGAWIVHDRDSRYGTFVNGAPVREHRLAHGDRIRLGRSHSATLLFLVDDEVPEAAAGVSSIVGGFRQIASLLDRLRALGGARVLDDVLALVLDAAIDVTGAERGFIMLATPAGTLEFTIARLRGGVTLSGRDRWETSRRIPEEVFATGREKLVADLRDTPMAGAHEGTLALGIRHVLCVPLRLVRYVEQREAQPSAGRAIGVLYLDSREKGTLLSPATLGALDTLASEAAVAIENARLYREALEKARIDQELKVAADIQRALLPPPLRHGPFFDAAAASVSSRAVGGDFFDYIELPEGRIGVALGDVAGKGTPAALLAAVLQGGLAGHAAAAAGPADALGRANRALLSRTVEARFATAFFATLSPAGDLVYCNAGHNPPFLFSGGTVRRLETGGTVLGAFATASYEQEAVRLAAGDTLVLFTDGVCEARNEADEEFGDARIVDAIAPSLAEPPAVLVERLMAAVRAFAGHEAQHDDMTAMVVRFERR